MKRTYLTKKLLFFIPFGLMVLFFAYGSSPVEKALAEQSCPAGPISTHIQIRTGSSSGPIVGTYVSQPGDGDGDPYSNFALFDVDVQEGTVLYVSQWTNGVEPVNRSMGSQHYTNIPDTVTGPNPAYNGYHATGFSVSRQASMQFYTDPIAADGFIMTSGHNTCWPVPPVYEGDTDSHVVVYLHKTAPPTPNPFYVNGYTDLAIYDSPDVDLKINGGASATINAGQTANLSWTPTKTNNGYTCDATGSWTGPRDSTPLTTPVPNYNEDTPVMNTPGTYTYNIQCDGALSQRTALRSVTLTVSALPVPTVTIYSNGNPVTDTVAYNGTANLTWASTNATSCTASGDWSGSKATNMTAPGEARPNLTRTSSPYIYTITCTGPGGSAQSTVNVNVTPAPVAPTNWITCNGAANCTIDSGTSATIDWGSTNATACTVTSSPAPSVNWTGVSGSQSTGALTVQTTYTVNCTGAGGSSTPASTVVSINPPDFTIACTPPTQTIAVGGATSFNITTDPLRGFSSTVAITSSISPNNGANGPSISFTNNNQVPHAVTTANITTTGSTTPGTYTITFTGTGGGQSHACTGVTLVVNAAPTVTLYANGQRPTASVAYNGTATLTWSSTDSTSCTASGDWSGSKATNNASPGEAQTNIITPKSYTLSCTGPGGTAQDTVTVTPGVEPDFTIACSPATQTIAVGGSTSFNITTDPLNGFNSAVAISSSVSPNNGANGPSVSFTNNNQVPHAVTVANITTNGSTTPGTYTITFTGDGGGKNHSCAGVTLIIGPAADFTVVCSPATQTIYVGGTTSFNITTASVNGFSSPVSFSASVFPNVGRNGPSVSLQNNNQVPPATTTAVISTTVDTMTGTYTYTFTGTGGGQTHQCSTTLYIQSPPAATASIFANGEEALTITSGSNVVIDWESTNTTACTISSSPAPSVNWTGTNGTNTVVNLTTTTTYTITCTGGDATDSVTVTVIPAATPDFSLNASPPTQTITVGGTTSFNLTTTPINGFSSQVALSTYSISPNSGNLPSISYVNNNQVPAAVTTAIVSTTASTTPGTYTILFEGTGGGQTHQSPVGLILTISSNPPPTNWITANGTSGSINVNAGDTATIAWGSANASSCTISSSPAPSVNWTGTSGSQSTGPLNITTTYTINCTGPGGSSTPASVIVNITSAPNPPATISIDVSICARATITWTAPSSGAAPTGYRVYRSTDGNSWSRINTTDPLPTSPLSYTDQPSTGNYYYAVTAMNGGAESTKKVGGPVFVRPCTADLSQSDKDITAASPVNISNSPIPCSGEHEPVILNGNKSFKAGDVVTFRINVCNLTGDAPVTGVVVRDTLTNLSNVTNVTYSSCSTGSYSLVAGGVNFTVGDVPAGGSCAIEFKATVTKPSTTSAFYRFQNRAVIDSTNLADKPVSTPLYQFTDSSGNPDRNEIAP